MANHPDQPHHDGRPAEHARDRARVRVRRMTTAIGVAAVTGAVGLGALVASETTAHSASVTTGIPSSGPTASSGPVVSSGPAPAATGSGAVSAQPTSRTPTVVSGQS